MFEHSRLRLFYLAALLVLLSGCAAQNPDSSQSAGEYFDDAVISSKVKSALLADKEVEGLDVKVETFRGVVQLSGFVESREDRQRAGAIARTIKGVRSVKNDIRLKGDP